MAKLRRTKEDIEKGLGHDGIEFGNALAEETDRGCALVAAEFINDALEQYFRRVMNTKNASENDIKDLLTSSVASLGNFSPRIKAAYWFNLIGKNTYDALDSIKEIRNQCAHRAGPIDFKDKGIEVHVRRLDGYWTARNEMEPIVRTVASMLQIAKNDVYQSFSPQRLLFTQCAAWIFLTIRILAMNPTEFVDLFFKGQVLDARW